MINWIYPECCPVCRKIVAPKGAMIHTECRKKAELIKNPICMKCGKPISDEESEYCIVCACNVNRGWDMGRSLFPYHGVMGDALRTIKSDGRTEFVRFFAKVMEESQQDFLRRVAPEYIVPVPLHPKKQRIRGFNQAELLANALGKETGIPVCNLLIKHKKTKEQKSLNKNQRIKNVRDAYAVDREVCKEVLPASVLLVDDVITTGSTLSACAAVLKEYGIAKVAFLSVCVAEQLE